MGRNPRVPQARSRGNEARVQTPVALLFDAFGASKGANPTPSPMLLFVYGTLRSGAENHAELRGARFSGRARTAPAYELIDCGEYPALVEGGADAIEGELYEVDDALLCRLDVFEDVPALYERKLVSMALDSPRSVEAYVMRRESALCAPRIASGDWCSRRR